MGIKLPGQAVPKWHELRDRIGTDKKLTGYDGHSVASAPETPSGPTRAAPVPKAEKGTEDPSSTATATVVLKALVRFPEAGQSALYDEAVAHYGEKRALRMMLRSALTAYDNSLRTSAVTEALPAYLSRSDGIRVSRAMSAAGFAKASALFDPLDMMPSATLAGDICRNALVWFFTSR